jgi:putative FmdB family regulatory protein
MPTYEYACRACGHRFDVVQSMTDPPLMTCPRCEGELRKVFAPPSISFKGSGFYATDHGKKRPPSDKDARKAGKDGKDAKGGKEGAGSADGGSATAETGSSSGSSSTGSSPTSGAKEPPASKNSKNKKESSST